MKGVGGVGMLPDPSRGGQHIGATPGGTKRQG